MDEVLKHLLANDLGDKMTRHVLADRLEELERYAEASLCRGEAPLYLSVAGEIRDATIRVGQLDRLNKAIVHGPWEDGEEIGATLIAYPVTALYYLEPPSRAKPAWAHEGAFRQVVLIHAIRLAETARYASIVWLLRKRPHDLLCFNMGDRYYHEEDIKTNGNYSRSGAAAHDLLL